MTNSSTSTKTMPCEEEPAKLPKVARAYAFCKDYQSWRPGPRGEHGLLDGRAEWSYVEHRPLLSNFCKLPVAAVPPVILSSVVHQLMSASTSTFHLPTASDHSYCDTMTSGRTCPLGRFYLWGLYSDVVYVSDQSTMELKQGDDEEKRMAETRTERPSCDPTPKTGRSRM